MTAKHFRLRPEGKATGHGSFLGGRPIFPFRLPLVKQTKSGWDVSTRLHGVVRFWLIVVSDAMNWTRRDFNQSGLDFVDCPNEKICRKTKKDSQLGDGGGGGVRKRLFGQGGQAKEGDGLFWRGTMEDHTKNRIRR